MLESPILEKLALFKRLHFSEKKLELNDFFSVPKIFSPKALYPILLTW